MFLTVEKAHSGVEAGGMLGDLLFARPFPEEPRANPALKLSQQAALPGFKAVLRVLKVEGQAITTPSCPQFVALVLHLATPTVSVKGAGNSFVTRPLALGGRYLLRHLVMCVFSRISEAASLGSSGVSQHIVHTLVGAPYRFKLLIFFLVPGLLLGPWSQACPAPDSPENRRFGLVLISPWSAQVALVVKNLPPMQAM